MRDDDRRHFAGMSSIPPGARLSQMMSSLLNARHWTLERAMREWARTDSSVAASGCAADQRVLDAVRQAFVDDGFDDEDADLRAMPHSPQVSGSYICPGKRPNTRGASRWERFLDLMLDYDTSRELAGALIVGRDVPRTAMV